MSKILVYSDIELPRTIIHKLTRPTVTSPDGTPLAVAKDAKLAFIRASTLFVSYLTSHSIDAASSHDVKTLTHEHVIQALKDCGWESWTQRISDSVLEYQQQTGRSRTGKDDAEDTGNAKESREAVVSDNEPATSDQELAIMSGHSGDEDINTQAPAGFMDQVPSSDQSSLSID